MSSVYKQRLSETQLYEHGSLGFTQYLYNEIDMGKTWFSLSCKDFAGVRSTQPTMKLFILLLSIDFESGNYPVNPNSDNYSRFWN